MISFADFLTLIRKCLREDESCIITPETSFEKDLYITGEDGINLLSAIEYELQIELYDPEYGYGKTFNLEPHELLFHAEGFNIFGAIFRLLTGKPEIIVRDFRVGHLYGAVINAQKMKETKQTNNE